MSIKFFSDQEIRRGLEQVSVKLQQASGEAARKAQHLRVLLSLILNNSDEFDERCQLNIEWIGHSIQSAITRYLEQNVPADAVDNLFGTLYRFVVEFDLSMKNDVSRELRQFLNFAVENANSFDPDAQRDFLFARQEMPIAIMKKLLGSDVLQNVHNIQTYSDTVAGKFKVWSEDLDDRERRTLQLKDALDKYKSAFNFVGLFQGFDQLSTVKTKEVTDLRRWLVFFGVLSICPLVAAVVLFQMNYEKTDAWNWMWVVGTVPAVTLTILFIYFFRIALRSSDRAKSQLLQIELRKTLCQFIQSYADYSKSLKESNSDTLSRFETIIFSGIVSSDEKLPATFDGLEQLTNMVKALRA